MKDYNTDDKIAALATPWAESALGVIRLSGKGCISAAGALFTGHLETGEARKLLYGYIRDPESGENLDEVMAVPFRPPASYTGQESVELYCHGSLPGLQRILALLFRRGFRQASPGEFTFRAFVNGRMDLTRAEAVQEIVSAKTVRAQSLALNRLGGAVEGRINHYKNLLLECAAALAIQLDYPEDEVGEPLSLMDKFREIREGLKHLADSYREGRIYQEGAVAVLAGCTNAGKSSLFNLFLKEDRAIVSDVHGTTRDYLESWISLEGIPFRLYDTAGLRRGEDAVEQEGIRRSREVMDQAHVLIYVVDGSRGLSREERQLMEEKGQEWLFVWNKADIASRPVPAGLLPVSAVTGQGFPELEQAVAERVLGGAASSGAEGIIDSLRQKELLDRALTALGKVEEAVHNGLPVDIQAMELQDVLQALGEITGEVSSGDILEKMFSGFCVGK